jgi:hypothetical protein
VGKPQPKKNTGKARDGGTTQVPRKRSAVLNSKREVF